MQPVYEHNPRYERNRPWVDFVIRHSYRKLQYVGLERIPRDGAIIYAPNHCNALCDALAVLVMDSSPKVFAARADIFRKPRMRAILTWLKMMPIRRIRDGIDEVRRNDETMDLAVETLRHGVPFCLMPEGTHRTRHSLLPLSKGIFRIALQANDVMGGENPVYIVPVGLEYGDYFHLWDSLTVQIGEPINVTEYAAGHPELDRPQMLLALREELTERMRRTFLWVPDDEHYEENSRRLLAAPPAPYDRMQPERLPAWLALALLVIFAPLFLLSLLLTVPLWLTDLIAQRKVKDKAFLNSVRIVSHVIFLPLSLFLMWPFWIVVEEYLFQLRHLKTR